MMSAVIEECPSSSDEDIVTVPLTKGKKVDKKAAKAKAAANEPKTITLVDGIGIVPLNRYVKKILVYNLNIPELITMYDAETDQKKWNRLYIVPLLIDYSASDQDKAGEISWRGHGLYDSFAILKESDMADKCPSLMRMNNWQKLFLNMFESNPQLKETLKVTQDYPLYHMVADSVLQMAVAEMCRQDYLRLYCGGLKA